MLDFQAAIFDLDGTLVDSLYVWEKVDFDSLAKRNIAVPPTYAKEIAAMSCAEIAEYTIAKFDLDDTVQGLIDEWNEMALYEYSHHVKLKPNVKEYLLYLKDHGIKLAVATATQRVLYEPVLKNNGIYHLFDALTSTDEVGCGKMNPDVFLLTAEKLGVDPKDCIVFEDVLHGIRGANAAGMRTFGVYDKQSEAEKEEIIRTAYKYVHDFKELI